MRKPKGFRCFEALRTLPPFLPPFLLSFLIVVRTHIPFILSYALTVSQQCSLRCNHRVNHPVNPVSNQRVNHHRSLVNNHPTNQAQFPALNHQNNLLHDPQVALVISPRSSLLVNLPSNLPCSQQCVHLHNLAHNRVNSPPGTRFLLFSSPRCIFVHLVKAHKKQTHEAQLFYYSYQFQIINHLSFIVVVSTHTPFILLFHTLVLTLSQKANDAAFESTIESANSSTNTTPY